MGRYYQITLTPPGPNVLNITPTVFSPYLSILSGNGTSGYAQWNSTKANGGDNPAALNIEFDFVEYPAGLPAGNSTMTIHGIALEDLQGAQQYYGSLIQMRAGMSQGLPLATAQSTHAGLIMQGMVFQSFANWIQTEMTLDFVISPAGAIVNGSPGYTQDNPGNFVFNWNPGEQLQDALKQMFKTVYPGIYVDWELGGNYPGPKNLGNAPQGKYPSLSAVGQFVKQYTKTATFSGVFIAYRNDGTLLVTDWKTSAPEAKPKQIDFVDLVGQPTWIQPWVMQATTVMRGDLQVGSLITMPQGLQVLPGQIAIQATSLPSQSQVKYQSAMQGTFAVISVRQVGNFRDPSGTAWVTILQCVPQAQAYLYAQ